MKDWQMHRAHKLLAVANDPKFIVNYDHHQLDIYTNGCGGLNNIFEGGNCDRIDFSMKGYNVPGAE